MKRQNKLTKELGGLLFFLIACHAGCAATPKQEGPIALIQKKEVTSSQTKEQEKEKMSRLATLYKEGNVAFKEKNYDKAIHAFVEILDILPVYRDVQKKLVEAHKAKEAQQAKTENEKETAKEAFRLKEYVVNLGDILEISVWEWPDLRTPEVYVRPDGRISFPLVGDIEAVGRTLTEIDDELTKKLTEYIRSPQVSVSIKRFGGKKVIVLGEVSNPGVYAPTGKSSLLEVIALAGGFSATAVTSNVLVIRGDVVKSEAIACDLRRALKGGDLSQNISTEPNDIIYVPRRFITSVSDLAGELSGSFGTTLAGLEVGKELRWRRPR